MRELLADRPRCSPSALALLGPADSQDHRLVSGPVRQRHESETTTGAKIVSGDRHEGSETLRSQRHKLGRACRNSRYDTASVGRERC